MHTNCEYETLWKSLSVKYQLFSFFDTKFDLELDIMVSLSKMMSFYGCIYDFIHLMSHVSSGEY